MRKIGAFLGVVFLAGFVNAATVTLTMRLHESATGTVTTANQFNLYATVSQGDNSGLFSFGVDLKTTSEGGVINGASLVNRTPLGTWDVDPTDFNFDPDAQYPTKFGGFGSGRGADAATGVVGGAQDLGRGADLMRIPGVGQTSHRMDDFRPAPDVSKGVPVSYAAYLPAPNTDGGATHYGNPPNPGTCGPFSPLPAGTVRLLSGSWTGAIPAFSAIETSSNTFAKVWKLNTTSDETESAQLQFVMRDFASVAADLISLTAAPAGPNRAAGGKIAVSGLNGGYSSEVNPLLDPPVNRGSAPIQTIHGEAGSVYVMAKLLGSTAEISNLMSCGGGSSLAGSSDPQFSALHGAYDSQFGSGGFNALFRFPNIAGDAKAFNWDFASNAGVTIDQLGAVPEPSSIASTFAAALLLSRRRGKKPIPSAACPFADNPPTIALAWGIIDGDAEGHLKTADRPRSRPARVLPGGGVCSQ